MWLDWVSGGEGPLDPMTPNHMGRTANVEGIEFGSVLVLERETLKVNHECIEANRLLLECEGDLKMREDAFVAPYIAAEFEVVAAGVVERDIGLQQVVQNIVVVELRITVDRKILETNQGCRDEQLETAQGEPEAMRR